MDEKSSMFYIIIALVFFAVIMLMFPGNLIATIRTNLSAEPMIILLNNPVPIIVPPTEHNPPYSYHVTLAPTIRYNGHVDQTKPVVVKAVIDMKGSYSQATISEKDIIINDKTFPITSEENIDYLTFFTTISSDKPPIEYAQNNVLQLSEWKKYGSYHFVSDQKGDFLITVENLETSIWDRISHPLEPPCYATFSIECKDSLKFVTLNDCKYCNEGMTDCNDCKKTVNLCGGSAKLKLSGDAADCSKGIIQGGGLEVDAIGGEPFVFGEKTGITFWLVDGCTEQWSTNTELLSQCSKEMLGHYEFLKPVA